MAEYTIKLDYSKLTVPDFIIKMKLIITSMTGNENFEKLADRVLTLVPLYDTLVDLQSQYDFGYTKLNKVIPKARKACAKAIKFLGMEIIPIADGDLMKLLSTRYDIIEPRHTSVVLGEIKKVLLLNTTTAGEVILTYDKVHGAKAYVGILDVIPHPSEEQVPTLVVTSTSNKIIFQNLIEASNIEVRLLVVGTHRQSKISNKYQLVVVKQQSIA